MYVIKGIIKMHKKCLHLILNVNTIRNLCIIGFLIYLCSPHRYAAWYNYIKRHEILDNLLEQTVNNSTLIQKSAKYTNRICDYAPIINENSYLYKKPYITAIIDPGEIKLGGEYAPDHCKPLYSAAIIIPYRKREEQLKMFITYMHNFLRKQNIHYRIFIVQQDDEKPFNRAKLFNIGAVTALKYGFPCLILHDVDLMPMRVGNIYACTKQPRHMCSSLDIFRFNLPYNGLFGGASAVDADTFKLVNGMSNNFNGWGGEDDDFYNRIITRNIKICRFDPKYSSYTMLKHKKEPPNEGRVALLLSGKERFNIDGINSLKFIEKDIQLLEFYTLVVVEI